jgi:hypothetical protein
MLKKEDKNNLRKLEKNIRGLIKQGEHWRIRKNIEIDEILKKEAIGRFIKARRIDWLGHVERMDANRMPRKMFMKGRILNE